MSLSDLPPSKVIDITNCPSCPSSDAYHIYEDEDGRTHGHCYSCSYHTRDPYEVNSEDKDPTLRSRTLNSNDQHISSTKTYLKTDRVSSLTSVSAGLEHPIRALKDRGITYNTCDHFDVRVGVSPTDGETPVYHLYPYHREHKVVGYKQKFVDDKRFISVGDMSDAPLFGADLIPSGGKKLWITEGELDALTCYQVLKESSSLVDWNPPVLSLPSGATSASKAIIANIDTISQYKEIILVFDMDTAGLKARKEVCKILAGKVYTLDLPLKDPNEMLLAGKGDELKWALLTKAKKYQPDGIVNAKDLWDRYKDDKEKLFYPYPPSMPKLNEMMYGAKPGTLVTVTAGTGSGKTQFLRELMYHFFVSTNETIAGIYLEEDVSDTLSGLLALHLNKRISLPDVKVTDEEETQAFKTLFGGGRISLYDYFGGMDDANLLGKLRYFAATGHKLIFLDHLSIVVSEYAAEGGERERIDTLMTKLAKFVKEYDVCLFLVVHLRKTSSEGTSFEEGAPPTLDDLRGSGSLKQLSWDVIGLSRPQQHPDPIAANTTEVRSLKCRLTGRTGIADYLYYDQFTGRMTNTSRPENYVLSKRKKTNLRNTGEF